MRASSGGRLRRLGGVLATLGAVAVLLPRASTIAIGTLLGLALVLSGLCVALLATASRGGGRRGRRVLAALAVLGGASSLSAPDAGVHALGAMLAGVGLLEGLLYCCVGLGRMHRHGITWGFGWALATGVVSLLAVASVLAGWPGSASWAIGLLVGLKLVASGAALVLLARVVDPLDASSSP